MSTLFNLKKPIFSFFLLLGIALSFSVLAQEKNYLKYVQPFSGISASTTLASQHIEKKPLFIAIKKGNSPVELFP